MNRKPLFDTVRRLLGRPFRQSEVDTLDDILDISIEDRCGSDARVRIEPVPALPASAEKNPARNSVSSVSSRHVIGPDGIALIRRFEGCARLRRDGMVEAYPDPGTGGDPWTIGWGATGAGIGPGTVWTQGECEERLARDLARYAAEVALALGGSNTTQTQFDALVSFHYNTGAIARATLTRLHKAGAFDGAAREFVRWCHAGGRVMTGLLRRREAEARLYRR